MISLPPSQLTHLAAARFQAVNRQVDAVPLCRPEWELLLQCARTELETQHIERITGLLAQSLDWSLVLALGRWHRLLPLLYQNLTDLQQAPVPSKVWEYLEGYYHANAARNVILTKALLRILQALEAKNIPAVPLKGPVLAELIYHNLALREFGDLDIWIPKETVLEAIAILMAKGFCLADKLTDKQVQFLLESRGHNHLVLVGTGGHVVVELHWGLQPHFFLPTDADLWRRLTVISLKGVTIRTFTPEDWLMLLCIHGGKHRWAQLEWVCGLAELIHNQRELDWVLIIEQMSQTGTTRMLWLGLALAHELLGAPLPPPLRRCITADPVVDQLVATVKDSFAKAADDHRGPLERWLFYYRLLPHWTHHRRHLRWLAHQIVIPTTIEWKWLRLPNRLTFIYYLARPLRLLFKYSLNRYYVNK